MFKGLAQVGIIIIIIFIFFCVLLIHRSLLLFYVMRAVGKKNILWSVCSNGQRAFMTNIYSTRSSWPTTVSLLVDFIFYDNLNLFYSDRFVFDFCVTWITEQQWFCILNITSWQFVAFSDHCVKCAPHPPKRLFLRSYEIHFHHYFHVLSLAVHRNCGVHNPSWFELRQFVNFLNHQLLDCEQSVYCDPELTGDTLEGFRIFVVRFMIIMSKVRVTAVCFTWLMR